MTKRNCELRIGLYPRVIGERDPNNPKQWRWGYNWEEKVKGVWKGRSIGLIPAAAAYMIRSLQQQGAAIRGWSTAIRLLDLFV
ncbi:MULTISPECIES: hypothetical protein [Nostoc]|uniref:hypothetical protein n=1 Tax=Nostoc TaxID=1177 RepID=UPI001F54C747|nr:MULTISPECIES: hypothetical protein [Nostoc]